MAPVKTHCKHGHLIAEVGRTPYGSCRGCQRQRKATRAPKVGRWQRPGPPIRKGEVLTVDARPFARWLRDARKHESVDDLARRLGISDTRIRSVLNGRQKTIHIDTVDRALVRDGTTHLRHLYPGLYKLPPLEDDE